MIPDYAYLKDTGYPFPRMSGDDPEQQRAAAAEEAFSPHERG